MSVLALGLILVVLNRLLFKITTEHFKLSISVLATVFIIGLFVFQLYTPYGTAFNWLFTSSVFGFAVIIVLSAGHYKHLNWVRALSPVRRAVLYSLLIAAVTTPVIYQAALENTDRALWQTAVN